MQKLAGGAPYLIPSWRKRQPYGSAMGLQAAPLRSPFKVVADALFSRRFSTFFILKQYLANSIKRLIEHNSCDCSIYIAISGVEIW